MFKITSALIDRAGRAVKVKAEDTETKKVSEVILSADFVFKAKDDIAKEFAEFLKEKGYDARPKNPGA